MSPSSERLLLHLSRDRRRAVDPDDVYFLEAIGETKQLWAAFGER